MGKVIVGYKPEGNPAGWGQATAGTIRSTTRPGNAKSLWFVRLGGRVGKFTSTAAVMRYALYQANADTWKPEALLGQTGTVSVTVLGNAATSNAGGANYELPLTAPVLVKAKTPITLAALGTAAQWWHGQDNSGRIMHKRSGLSSPPNPFAPPASDPEGEMALWGVTFENTPPTIPTNTLSPKPGTTTTDPTPAIGFDFRDAEEVLEGFAIGAGDYLLKYQVQLYSGSTKIYDSGILPASSGQRTARRVTLTLPDDIDPGVYKARVQVWDRAEDPSGWREWTFTRVGAGSLVLSGPTGIINDTTPDFAWSYSHAEDLAMDRLITWVTNAAGVIVRPAFDFDFSVDPVDPSTGTMLWADTGWTALPAGQDYLAYAQAVDTDGQPSPASAPLAFHVNAAPMEPAALQPAAGYVTTSPPQLSALITDVDDQSSTLAVTFRVRDKSTGGSGTPIAGLYDPNSGRWFAESGTPLVVGGYDDYEWQVQATDPHGLAGPVTAWRTLSYVAPPEITIVAPTGTATTSSPAFEWDIDRAQTSFRLRLFDADSGAPLPKADSGWITRTSTSHVLPHLLLRNDTTVRALLEVVTAGDVPGSIEWEFAVEYTPPPEVTGFTATPKEGPFDYPGHPSIMHFDWNQVATNETDFDSYSILRRPVGTETWDELVRLPSVATTEWDDTTPSHGVVYEWAIVQNVWIELDAVSSEPVIDQGSVHLMGTVVSVVIGGQGQVALPFWRDRRVQRKRDRVARSNWSRYPRISTGPGNYRVISGTFRIHVEPGLPWSPEDLVAAVTNLADTWLDTEGRVRDKVLCYRDPRRTAYVSLMRDDEEDLHDIHGEMDLEFIEVGYPGGAS